MASSPLFNLVTRKQDLRAAALGGMLSTLGPLSEQFVTVPNSNKTGLLIIALSLQAAPFYGLKMGSVMKVSKVQLNLFIIIQYMSSTLTDFG